MHEHITQHLLAHVALTALIGDRLHWSRLPSGEVATPYLILQDIDSVPTYHSRGDANLYEDRLQADVYATEYDTALAVARIVRDRLSAHSGTAQGARVLAVFFDGWRDLTAQTTGGHARLYRLSADFLVHWKSET